MVNLDEFVRFDKMTLPDLIAINELIKIGVVRFDLNNPTQVLVLTHIINTINDFGAESTKGMSEQERLIHQQKYQLLTLTAQRLLQTAIPSEIISKVS